MPRRRRSIIHHVLADHPEERGEELVEVQGHRFHRVDVALDPGQGHILDRVVDHFPDQEEEVLLNQVIVQLVHAVQGQDQDHILQRRGEGEGIQGGTIEGEGLVVGLDPRHVIVDLAGGLDLLHGEILIDQDHHLEDQ